jgi:hypothetical protein
VREAERLHVPVPLHTALLRLVRAKEASWGDENGDDNRDNDDTRESEGREA